MNIEEDDLGKAITSAASRLAHVHVDDSNRLQPGTGHLDFGAALDALHLAGVRAEAADGRRGRAVPA